MYTPKWFKTDKELKKRDIVYFRKKGRDNIISMISVKYFNGSSLSELSGNWSSFGILIICTWNCRIAEKVWTYS
jgi:hypothetical protein